MVSLLKFFKERSLYHHSAKKNWKDGKQLIFFSYHDIILAVKIPAQYNHPTLRRHLGKFSASKKSEFNQAFEIYYYYTT